MCVKLGTNWVIVKLYKFEILYSLITDNGQHWRNTNQKKYDMVVSLLVLSKINEFITYFILSKQRQK